MSKKFFFFILAAAGVIFTAFLLISKYKIINTPEVSPTPQVNSQNATLVINYGGGNTSTYNPDVVGDSTVFSLLKTISEKENILLETQQYDFGVFVKTIGSKESGSNMAWIYFVNGESGTIAADQMKVNPGDTIEWKYTPPSEE